MGALAPICMSSIYMAPSRLLGFPLLSHTLAAHNAGMPYIWAPQYEPFGTLREVLNRYGIVLGFDGIVVKKTFRSVFLCVLIYRGSYGNL